MYLYCLLFVSMGWIYLLSISCSEFLSCMFVLFSNSAPDDIDSVSSIKGTVVGVIAMNQSKISSVDPSSYANQLPVSANYGNIMPSSMEKNRDKNPEISMNGDISQEVTVRQSQQNPVVNDRKKGGKKMQHDSGDQNVQNGKSLTVFKGKTFCFSKSFPEDRVSS